MHSGELLEQHVVHEDVSTADFTKKDASSSWSGLNLFGLKQAIADGMLVETFKNRWGQLSGGKPIVATAHLFEAADPGLLRDMVSQVPMVGRYGEGYTGLDHSVGHLRTCAVDFEARVADRQKPKSP